MKDTREEGHVVTAEDIVTQKLAAVEAQVDSAIQDVIHEARHEAQEVVDQTLNRVKEAWERRRRKIEQHMAAHPWMVLGGLVLLGYIFADRSRPRYR